MAVVELGRYRPFEVDIVVGKLRSEGIAAFPNGLISPYPGTYGMADIGVLIDDSDLAAARRILAAAPDVA